MGGVTATQLKTLWVKNTPNLKHLWNEDPKGILKFHNLSNVDIRGCSSLKSVFPASVARGIVNLEFLYVLDSAIKEIIAAGDHEELTQGASVFEFPRLKELVLRRLPKLETFYPAGTHTSGWPKLQKAHISECNQFHLLSLFHEKLEIIPNLEELVLNGKEVKMIRDGQLPVELFHKLKVVEFRFYKEEPKVFPYDLLHVFHNLETFKVAGSKLKELFPPQGVFVGDEKHPLILTRMRSLELWWLPNLKTIWNQVLQTLESLLIHGCDNLIILAQSPASFQSLTSLNIEMCKGLVSVVTFSTAAGLMQLQKLRVSNCSQMKVIVSDEGDETTNEINFIKLETLVLNCLASLTSFCSGNHSFKFPSLTKLVVNQCPKMDFFSKGVSTTPMLEKVEKTEKTEKAEVGDWLGSLDLTMRFLYKNMVGFRGLQHLKLSEFSNLKDRWHNEFPVEIFCDLSSLVIDEVAFSSYGLPSNLLEHLNKLEKLEVNNCELLEEVFDLQGLGDEAQEQSERGLLSKLKTFHLINLPRLRQVWNEHPRWILNFNHLKLLKVQNCCSLRMIFTPSMTQGLAQLQEMEVKNCISLEEIISKEVEEDDIICFPQLNTLVLDSLPKLTVFRRGRGIVQCPSLEKISVMDCPNIEFLPSSDDDDGNSIFFRKVVFPNLKDLKLSPLQIHNKQQLGISAFAENLTSLNIDSCGNLKYLFSSSMVKGFVHLKTLELCNCKLMEEIIHMEKSEKMNEIVLRKLEFLNLKNLQQLKQFCTGNLIVCVGLTRLWLENCPEFGAFISNSAISPEIVNSTLFDEKVDFPNLEALVISGVHGLKVIWGNEFHQDSFGKLKQLKVHDAKQVVKVFPPNSELVTRFQNLERLEICGCDALTEVFDIRAVKDVEIGRGGVTATQLKTIWVKNTPNLKHLWNEDPKGILDFHNLSNVAIQGCSSLKSVFPASIARGIVNLEFLYVLDSAIKEIIPAGDPEELTQGASVFEFPRLKELALRRLPKLETFYPAGTHTSEWPKLQKARITQCNQFHLPTLSFKKIIPNLEELSLTGKEVRMIREGQLPVELFCTLKVVEFNFFKAKSAVFPYDLLHIFHNLETLQVVCSNLKELFPSQGGVLVDDEKYPLILTRMHSLELYYLPNLKTIWNQVLQTLESLFIRGCENLIILAPSSASFQSLTSLKILECKRLVSLVTSSTAKSLIHLQKLKVSKCDRVKVIISDERDETMDEINFIKLEILELDCLPSLTCFCSGNQCFKFPSLTKVVVNQCPKMEFFSEGISSTLVLARVQLTERENRGDWLGNLNSTIRFLYKKMVGFQGLQHLKLSEFSNLKDRWHNELPLEIFCGLNSLVIDEVAFSSYAIPSNLLEHLNILDKLEVSNCELLEEVFDLQGLSDKSQGQRGILSKLKEFHLIDLPRLRQVWNEHPRQILNFNNLKSLKVHKCCSLRMIFTPSMTRGLVQLQELEVKNCVLVEEIISKGAEKDDIISLPQLNSLVLASLPKLTVFHPGKGIVQCPSLEKIIVTDCPKIEVITSSADEDPEPIKYVVKCQSIKELRVDWSNNIKEIWDGELAATHEFFCSLKVLELKHFPVEYSTFPSGFLERSPNLEELVVSDASFDEIFSQEVTINIDKESSKNVTRLRQLTLSKLPQLKHLIKDQNEPGSLIQQLEAFEVLECTKLIILVPSSISFQNLKTLKVSKCHGLLNLITSSTARSLSQLTRLEITECEMLEGIVASEGDEIEAEIVFSQLKHLELHSLPKLARFCSGNETFNFPSLEEVIVRECPKMEIFVRGELSTPNLECVQTTEDEWYWDGSLSATIQKLFKETNDRKVEEH